MGLFGKKREKYSPDEREKMGLKVAVELPHIFERWYHQCVAAVTEEKPNLQVNVHMSPSCQKS